ncbi:MAG: class I SAM-dependent RNA methyltransferase [Planctomycetaceae bacterium]
MATTSFGLEAVVARELKQLGYDDCTVTDGRVTFVGDELALCRANLWLRCAERVFWKLAEFPGRDFDELFEGVKSLGWRDWLPTDAAIPVRGRSVRSQLSSVPACQSIVKKAIVESMKSGTNLSRLPETGPEYAVEFSLLKDRVTIALDISGAGLHKRGYRTLTGQAPLRETLAAGLVLLSFWNRERPFVDPFCGTGTIPIEAALIGRNIAPGMNRTFAAEVWPTIPPKTWEQAREEARDAITNDLRFTLIGTDRDAQALRMARYHAEKAGVAENIHFQQKEFSDLTTKRSYGCLICNPPYGERVGELAEAEALYREMAGVLAGLETWSFYVLTSHPKFESLFGRKADRRRKLYNGRIECTYYQYHGKRPPRRKSPTNDGS